MKILIIPSGSSDYLQDSIYLGLKDLYGTDVESILDCSYLYKGCEINRNLFWGKGFTYTNILPPELNVVSTNTVEKIQNNYYDIIIYSFVSRNSAMLDEVMRVTNGKNVILINGEDENHRFEHYNENVLYFKRELVTTEKKNILPINYAIHKSKLFLGEKIIKQELSNSKPSLDNCTPTSSSFYIFDNEVDYYNDYQISKFGVTKKKGGWDSMRHYEILANKCIPLFDDLNECPVNTLTNLPKKTLIEITNNYPNISDKNYYEYLEFLNTYTLENLTTDKLGTYVISKL
jgi:hypothetical protein